ncbi:TRAP transporter small permease [Ponticaulis sp.]|uniref:TRAP transporter small permease n=1 Tax=Ponticaulis sp. TaxID=2020902 RepID=UPI000B7452C0|nr:TRAP transporter small permease [Ponticaulis sp.]MAJ09254.1 TRAP transporter permease DctQ [Ponticaulis sp.]HBH89625.1 TRAP transporter small permease [Hyphomonadaceae bacterium]HBJ92135.1 TRAP transporter small permease [Hyphomonadaceae bacterium]|tara:strand:- start:3734 stop:4243 length:510 start_codon:yes stop_codon:yes gene_type:complete
MKHNLANVTHFAAELLLRIAAFGLVLMTVIVGWQVFGRYVLNSSPSWSEQAALTLMIWYVLLAAAAGVREGFHIRIVALEEAVGPKAKRGMRMVQDLIVAGCGIAMTIWGGELVIRTWEHIIPSLGLPRGLAYLALPISGVLIALFSLERMLEEAEGENVEDEEDPRWS